MFLVIGKIKKIIKCLIICYIIDVCSMYVLVYNDKQQTPLSTSLMLINNTAEKRFDARNKTLTTMYSVGKPICWLW